MGLFDFFGGGSGPDKALKLKPRVTQKYGEPATRQKALQQLGAMKIPEAVSVLMARFTLQVEPATLDAEEKEMTFRLVEGFGEMAVEPVKAFLRDSEQASSWAVRLLEALLPADRALSAQLDTLEHLAGHYTRTPEKKVVLLQHVSGKADPRVGPVAQSLLDDMADDVKIAALGALGQARHAPAREAVLQLLTNPDTARRVQLAALGALADAGLGVQGYREKVEALLTDEFLLDKSGVLKRRA